MKVYEKVFSTEMPDYMKADENHFYINTGISVVEDIQELMSLGFSEGDTVYSYTVTEYTKDEYIVEATNIINNMTRRVYIPPEEFFAVMPDGVNIDGRAIKQGNNIHAYFEITPEEGKRFEDLLFTVRSTYSCVSQYSLVDALVLNDTESDEVTYPFTEITVIMMSLGSSYSSPLVMLGLENLVGAKGLILSFNYMSYK